MKKGKLERINFLDLALLFFLKIVNLAPSAIAYFLYSLLIAAGFVGVPIIIFLLQKKDIKYEIRHRIVPDNTLYRNKQIKYRLIDIGLGLIIGVLFYFIGNYLYQLTRIVIVNLLGEEFFQIAQQGSVNTSPPAPPPNLALIWLLIITGIIVQFVVVAFSEEFCFRGVILKELNHISKTMGIIISSALFMLYHVIPGIVPLQTFVSFSPYYFSFGLLLAFSSLVKKQDLIVAITAHATFNSILWVLQYSQYL